jgi:Divergent InlB B-repeat domain
MRRGRLKESAGTGFRRHLPAIGMRTRLGLGLVMAALLVVPGALGSLPGRQGAQRTVTVVILAGQGNVTSSPAGIDCPSVCSAQFDTTQSVTLTATAGNGYSFEGWSSPCSIQPTCELEPRPFDDRVEVTFRPGAMLRLVANGPGAITVSPPGVVPFSSGATESRCELGLCELEYLPGTEVSVVALPQEGSQFVGFSDYRCPVATTCQLPLSEDVVTLAATFSPLQLNVLASGPGRVVSSPAGIDCDGSTGGACTASYPAHAEVVLTATGAQPEWIAGCTPEGGDVHAARCHAFAESSPTWVVMRFDDAEAPGIPSQIEADLTVAVDGGGTVHGDHIDCGSQCRHTYGFGDREHLRADASQGFMFQRWVNGCGSRQTCEFAVGPITSLRAVFVQRTETRLEAHLLDVAVRGRRGSRRVVVRLSTSVAASLALRLETRRGVRVASRVRALPAGTTTTRLGIPRRTRPGRYRLVVTVTRGGERARFSRLLTIGR